MANWFLLMKYVSFLRELFKETKILRKLQIYSSWFSFIHSPMLYDWPKKCTFGQSENSPWFPLIQIRGSSSTFQEWQCVNNSSYLRRLVSPLRMKLKLICDFSQSTPEACSNFSQESETILYQKLTHFSNVRRADLGWAVIILSQIHKEWSSLSSLRKPRIREPCCILCKEHRIWVQESIWRGQCGRVRKAHFSQESNK